jgi:S-adenosyl-L-methionine hydrolase (adenosine-forming)
MVILTLLTDFGTADYYVAALKGTVLGLTRPGSVQLVDLGHEVLPGDIEAAADLLAAAAPAFPRGTCHLAVVDPGVGSARRMLIAETPGQRYLAPDNGLLTWVLQSSESWHAWSVVRPDLYLPAAGGTFHGRDRFAPIAAALLRGEIPDAMGPRVEDPVLLSVPAPRCQREGNREVWIGRVRRVDRFGNLVTDLVAAGLGGATDPSTAVVEVAGREVRRWAGHYAELPLGEPTALVGSLGTVELSLRGESLAAAWGVGRGLEVRIVLGDGGTPRDSPG